MPYGLERKKNNRVAPPKKVATKPGHVSKKHEEVKKDLVEKKSALALSDFLIDPPFTVESIYLVT